MIHDSHNNKCPFILMNGRCSHRSSRWRDERKPKCIFAKANNCDLFREWYSKLDTKEKKELNEMDGVKNGFARKSKKV